MAAPSASAGMCNVTIDFGNGTVENDTVAVLDGWTGFNATVDANDSIGFENPMTNVTVGDNEIITGFNGTENDVDGYNWTFYIRANETVDWYLFDGFINEVDPDIYTEILWNYTNAPMEPQFTVDLTSPYNYDFNASASNASSYAWDFGDNSTGNGDMVNHTYALSGTYNVTLTCTNDVGYGILTKQVTVLSPPVADFTYTTDALTLYVNASVSEGDDLTYAWDFGDNSTDNGESVNHTYALLGTYNVTLTCTNDADNDTVTKQVRIGLPVADFDYTTDSLTLNVNASASVGDNLTYAWDFGDDSNGINVTATHVYAESGDYNVTLTVTNSTGNDTVIKQVSVNKTVTANFTSTIDAFTLDVNASASEGDDLTYAWDFGDNSTATGATATHVYAAVGDYTVTLNVTDSHAMYSVMTENVTINAAYVIFDFGNGTMMGTNVTINEGDTGWNVTTAACDDLEITYNHTEYSWGIMLNSFNNVTNNYPSDWWGLWLNEADTGAPYTISENGISNINLTTYHVIYWNYSAQMYPMFTSAVDGLTVDFNATGSNANNYTWDFGDNTTGYGMIMTHDYAESGNYNVTLTCTNDLSIETTTQAVNIDGATVFFDFGNGTAVNATVTIMAGDSGWNVTVRAADALGLDLNYSEYSFGIVINGVDGVMNDFPNDTWGLWTKPVVGTELYELSAVGIADVEPLEDRAILWSYDQTLNPTFTVDKNGLAVVLNASAVGDNLTYEWALGDGAVANTSVVDHTYNESGNYIVTLVIENSYGFVEVTQQVSVNKTVVAAFNYTTDTLALNVDASASEGDNLTYAWDFGDGGIGAGVTATHDYATAGNYTVTLTVTDSHAVSSDTSESIIIEYTEPTASFTESTDGLTVSVNATASTGENLTYAWDFGDDTNGTGMTAEHEYSEAGTYNVTLTVTDASGHTATHVEEVTVEAPASDNTMLYAGIAIVIIIVVAIVAYMMMKKPSAGATAPEEPVAEEPSAEEPSEEEE